MPEIGQSPRCTVPPPSAIRLRLLAVRLVLLPALCPRRRARRHCQGGQLVGLGRPRRLQQLQRGVQRRQRCRLQRLHPGARQGGGALRYRLLQRLAGRRSRGAGAGLR